MILPVLLAGALLAGAAFAAWKLFQSMNEQRAGQTGVGNGETSSSAPPPPERRQGPPRVAPYEQLIARIVREIKFAQTRAKIGESIVGSDTRTSMVPTDEMIVRPFRTVAELSGGTASTRSLPDDLFIAGVASRSLHVVEFQETVELTEDIYGPPRKALLHLQDISSSMVDSNHPHRIPWSVQLAESVIDRCENEGASYALIRFSATIYPPVIATDSRERTEVRDDLRRLINTDGGGTDIHGALEAGLDFLEAGKFTEIRIVLVTDGTQAVDVNNVRERLAALNAHLHTIVIGEDNDSLRAASDQYDFLDA